MRHLGFGQSARLLIGAGLLLLVSGVVGQVPGSGPSPAGMNSALVRLFGANNFTAVASVTVKDASGNQVLSTPMDFALLEGKLRVQIDVSQMKNKEMSPAAATSLMQMGLARVVSVIRPDKQAVYVIYPDRKALVHLPFSKEDAAAAAATPKIQRTVLGKETVDGHPCNKVKVVMTTDKAPPIEAITWNATDLKEFPIQVQTTERGNTSVILFRQLRFSRPEAKLFDPPAGFTTYASPQELMQGVARDLQKAKGGAPAPKK